MLKIAYLSNQFPSPVEPYVVEEIEELGRRGVCVISGSVRMPTDAHCTSPQIVVLPLQLGILLKAAWLCIRKRSRILGFVGRVIYGGREGALQRVKALLHTLLGACYAVQLEEYDVDHIHVHHGYFGSWVGMVAARLLGVGFSLTLHGSDLLVHGKYLDVKLANCDFCVTISEYNRRSILKRYPNVSSEKVYLSRLGVEAQERIGIVPGPQGRNSRMSLLAVGRLHAVKDHAFLVRACAQLHTRGVDFECFIAGEGPERRRLQSLIRNLGLEANVTLLGHVPREQMDSLYDRADVVVLTSRSEGIPLVLMEAMACGRIVLAPHITGIPELVIPGKTGFLYEAGSQGDFVARLLTISLTRARCVGHRAGSDPECFAPHLRTAARQLAWMPHAARTQVRLNFNRAKNLELFGELFTRRITPRQESTLHENSLLQQIQLPV